MSLFDLSSFFCISNAMAYVLPSAEQGERSAEADATHPCCRGNEILVCKAWPVSEDEDVPFHEFRTDETVSTAAMTVASPVDHNNIDADADTDVSKAPSSPTTTSLAIATPPDFLYEQKIFCGTIGIYLNLPLEQDIKKPPKPLEWYTPKKRKRRSFPLRSSYRL